MSRRRELRRRLHGLGEIRDIMNSMKTLAYVESRNLVGRLEAQHTVVSSIAEAAADFLCFYPEASLEGAERTEVCLVVGTERGFCGEFNHALAAHLDKLSLSANARLLLVGHKLHLLFESDPRVAAYIDGPGVLDEVPAVLSSVADRLNALREEDRVLTLAALCHDENETIRLERLLPPFQDLPRPTRPLGHPPLLNLSPERFMVELTDQYMFAALHETLYASLMAESRRRVTHLEGAVNHLDEEAEKLRRTSNALRQEEIIEEIEVILLSAADAGRGGGSGPYFQ
jgi:F-type H+-transporting ATPase subunit gamma